MKIRDRIKDFRRVPASELRPNPKNWRTHPKAQMDALRGLLAEVGFAGAELARELTDGSLMLIDGHARAEIMGQELVPVLVLDVSEAEADKILATFDPVSAMAGADTAQLDALLRTVETGSEDVAKMLESLAKDAGCDWAKGGEIQEDEVPEAPTEPVTKPGDLWLMGEHRLLCGDSTDGATVARLFSGARASLLFTSPPYAQQRDYGKAKEHCQDWDGLMQGVFQHCDAILEPDGQVLVNLGLVHRDGEWMPYWDAWIAWMRERGWRRFGWYVWDQGSGLPGDLQGRLAPSHEFIFHFNRKPMKPAKWVDKKPENIAIGHGTGLRGKSGKTSGLSAPEKSLQPTKIPDSVLRITRHMGRGIEMAHAAVFPVAFASAMLQSWPGLAYEPFSGAGTTIIAAEQLGRRCYAMELEPQYCDVALTRWRNLTGKTPTKEDGTPFPL